jgi:hypothetical protein
MKVASSSASFAAAFARGELTQLEWLDLCANELELDGVVFEAAHFPRLDADYLAQLKKWAVDLGLTVAAVAADGILAPDGARWLDVACALGAPLVVTRAAAASDQASGWGAFAETLGARARDAKRLNVTLALRDAPATLCTDSADLARAAKDVDSAWLRYALDTHALAARDPRALAKAVIAQHAIGDLVRFATDGDPEAHSLIAGLARFRGFVVLDAAPRAAPGDAYHRAIERFTTLRATRLAAGSGAPTR